MPIFGGKKKAEEKLRASIASQRRANRTVVRAPVYQQAIPQHAPSAPVLGPGAVQGMLSYDALAPRKPPGRREDLPNCPGKRQDTVPAASEPKETPEEAVWRDWSGRGQHVEFKEDEKVPLEPGDTLGRGSNGYVVKTNCKGVVLAWKSKVYAPRDEPSILKEKDILMRLDHIHTVKMIGTYKHQHPLGRIEVGLLTWPVAVCDLAAFLKDLDHFTAPEEDALARSQRLPDDQQKQRLESLGFDLSQMVGAIDAMGKRMLRSFGCLASAVAYLHSREVKHKDIKPANVLIYRDTVRLTDFGTSRDFSELGMSATDNGGARGTAKYFSPETATWSTPGRPADIFSLGCVFLEMVYSLSTLTSLAKLDELRPEADSSGRSYQANLARLYEWTRIERSTPLMEHLLCEVRRMLNKRPDSRPKAEDLNTRLGIIGQLGNDPQADTLHSSCCSQLLKSKKQSEGELKQSRKESTHLTNLNRDLEQKIEIQNVKIEQHQNQLQQLAQHYQALKKEAENGELMIHELKEDLKAKEKNMAPLTQKLEMIGKELEERQSHVEKLEGTLTAYMKTSSENSRLRKEMFEKERDVAASQREAERLRARQTDILRERNVQVESLTEKINNEKKARSEQKAAHTKELEDLMAQTDYVERKYNEIGTRFNQEQAMSKKLQREISRLEQQRNQAVEERDTVYTTFNNFGATFKRFDEELRKQRDSGLSQNLPAISRTDSGYETRNSNASSLSSIVQPLSPSPGPRKQGAS